MTDRRGPMLPALAERIAARPRRVLIAAALFTVLAAVIGGPIFGLLESGDGFTDRDSDSSRAEARVDAATGLESSAGIVVLLNPDAPVQSESGLEQVRHVAAGLRQIPGVEVVDSAADGGEPRFVSRDGRSTHLAATLSATADDDRALEALDDRFGDRDDIELGGALLADEQLGEQISEDLGRAETMAFPLLILLSFLFFRGARAAALPLLIGMTTVLGTFLLLRVVNEVHELSIFCLNLVIGLGLGLAIDYTLFLLTRYREEMERNGPSAKALRDTMATAGRTVVFSAATVAIALATLIVFPLNFLKSMAIGGAGVAIVAAVAACTIAPAFFALWNVKLKARDRGGAHDRWYRLARRVMARPGAIAAITALVMLALAIPSLRAIWTPVDIGTVPEGLSARTVGDALARDFPRQDSSPLLIVADGIADAEQQVGDLAGRVAALDGVAAVQPPQQLDDSTWRIDAIARGDAAGEDARKAVDALRSDPGTLPVLIGGEAAEFIDQQEGIGSRLLLAIVLLGAFPFVVLWLMTGSVVLPVKALAMNVLTVGATLGLLTLIFQDGRFQDLLGYTAFPRWSPKPGGIQPDPRVVWASHLLSGTAGLQHCYL